MASACHALTRRNRAFSAARRPDRLPSPGGGRWQAITLGRLLSPLTAWGPRDDVNGPARPGSRGDDGFTLRVSRCAAARAGVVLTGRHRYVMR